MLFAYRAFFLLYGRDPQLPTEEALCPRESRHQTNLETYKSTLMIGLADAWEMARAEVKKAQRNQKRYHDRHAQTVPFQRGDRVFVHKPGLKRGKAHKFYRPFQGPYRIIEIWGTGAEVLLIEKPKAGTIRVALDRLRRCPKEISGTGGTQEEPTEEDNEEPLSGVLQEESCDQLEGPGFEISSDPLEDNRPVAQTAAGRPWI